jgi:hypothetical protein
MYISDFGIGFGWVFHAFREHAPAPSFLVALKSLLGWRDSDYLDRGIKLGEQCVHDVIDRDEEPTGTYCFRWEPGPESPMSITEVDCGEISVDQLHAGS